MPRNDLLYSLQHGQVRAGDYLIDITSTLDGGLTYSFFHIETDSSEAQVASNAYDRFDDALMHALGHISHELRAHADGDDSVEGPARDLEVATNMLQAMCEARGLAPQAFTPKDPASSGTTLHELYDVLSTMLDDGIDPDTPIRMRTHPREPNLITDPPAAPLEDIWHNEGEQTIYLDEPGI